MNKIAKRNRLTPWYIGIAIVLAAIAYTGYQMFVVPGCDAPAALGVVILGLIPVVYLVLMYMTLTSQD